MTPAVTDGRLADVIPVLPHKSKTLADVHSWRTAVFCAFQVVAGQVAAVVCFKQRLMPPSIG